MRTYTPDDIVQSVVRRRWLILLPFALGLAAAPLLAQIVPEKYRSETLIMVVPQRVPDSYVKPTITEGIEDRLPSISEQILSRSRLERIITEMDLYKDRREKQVMEDVVQAMRQDVNVSLVGDRGKSADSFRMSYVSDSADTARKVTERLAAMVIDQNKTDRATQADSTSVFLDTQLQEAKQRLIEQEKRLEEYRKAHSGELPTQLQGNLQSIQNSNLQLQALNESMNRALERRLLIERQIADTEALALQAPAEPTGSNAPVPTSSSQRLELARARLAGLLQFYTADHPEVQTLERLVGELQGQVASEAPLGEGAVPERVLSPAEAAQRKRILDLRSELAVIDRQLESNRAEAAKLQLTIASLQARVDLLPSRESELVELTRDYSTLQAAYGSLLLKREDSMIAANLERGQIGEQFRILDAASTPERPYNETQRLAITVSGAGAGLALGLLLIGFLEYRDSSFRREEDVMSRLSLPVLALIPVMSSDRERQAVVRRLRWADMAGTTVLLAAIASVVFWRLQL